MAKACARVSVGQGLPGDANGDGRIDVEDVRLIVERILERGVLPGDGDCNRDATINVLDTVCSQLPFVPGETAPIILGPGDRSIPAGSLFEMNLFAADPDAGATQTWAQYKESRRSRSMKDSRCIVFFRSVRWL